MDIGIFLNLNLIHNQGIYYMNILGQYFLLFLKSVSNLINFARNPSLGLVHPHLQLPGLDMIRTANKVQRGWFCFYRTSKQTHL